jgi:hypothetical protein
MRSTTKKAIREKLERLHTEGARPEKMKTTEGIGLRSGRRMIALVDNMGNKTPAGRYWEQTAGEELPSGGFLQQTAVREGNVETIRLRDGRKGVTRRWNPGTGEYKFTALGKRYYATLRRNYVADVPVVIKGKRKNGTEYTIRSHMKVEKLGLKPVEVPLNLTLDKRRKLVQESLEKQMVTTKPIYEVSDEQWWFDEDGSWAIHEETVGVDPETNEAEAHVVLDRRNRAPRPLPSGCLLFQDAICEEAFVESQDNLRMPRQIAAVLRRDMGQVCIELTKASLQLYGTEVWEDQGATPRMVLEFCKNNAYGCVIVHNEEVIESLAGNPVLAFAVHEDHAYFYADRAARSALAKRSVSATVRLRKAQKTQTQTPPASEWKPWSSSVEPGHFWCMEDEIGGVRAWFLENGMNPKVVMRDETRLRNLIHNVRKKGACIVHSLPEYAQDLDQWLQRLDIGMTYRGEGLPALSLKVLQTLVRRSRERVWLTGEEKAEILEEYGFCCAMCGSRGELEFDHIARLSESYDEQKFQPLCVECHREKTSLEARMYDDDQLASHFELEVWKQYVASERPPPLVAKLKNATKVDEMEIVDVIRCRRSALLHNTHALPVFCPLDDIKERTEPTLGDLNFVTKPAGKKTQFAGDLGYTGPGWQHRVQTEWLLHTGVIAWEDVSHTLTATAHLPAGLLAEPLEKMEHAWNGDATLGKLSVNSLIGLWCIDEATSLKVRTSTREDDAPRDGCLTSTFHYEGGYVYDFMTRTPLVTNASCRPLHDLCMCTEAVRVGQILLALRISEAVPYEVKTDSVLFKPKKRRPVTLDQLTFRDLGTLYTSAYPLARPKVQLSAIPSMDRPFRQNKAVERDLLAGDGCFPVRNSRLELRPRLWRQCEPEEGEFMVMQGESLLVQGIAGTGKTTYCRGIVERLQAAGERVDIISKTHVASRRAGGVTADHWVRRHVINGSPLCTVLWIDEVSQIDIGLLLHICKLTYTSSIRFILSGDFHQFAPIGNNFRGTPIAENALELSNLLHTLSSGNRVVLTECRRSDAELFGFYASLVGNGSRVALPLRTLVAEARVAFNFGGFCRSNLVISHRKRVWLNRKINEELAPPAAVKLEIYGRPLRGNSAQTMLIWPGIQLLGAVPTERKGIRNGCLYTVTEIGEDSVRLQEVDAELTFDQVKSWLRLSYAQTYASVQGTEFDAQLRLHDVGHRFFTRRHLFVGLSRARSARDVSVVD